MASLPLTLYRTAAAVAGAAPASTLTMLARGAGVGASLPDGARRLLVRRNLTRAHGRELGPLEMRAAVQATFASYAHYWIETFRLPHSSAAEIEAGMAYEGYEHIERSVARGRGTIVVLPHLGGWEWAAFWMCRLEGFRITAVVERLEPPDLYEWFVELRRSIGLNVVPLGPGAGAEVAKALKRGDIVTLLSDRDVAGGGVEVNFFGEPTTLPAGPATLALRTGADLVPAAIYFRGTGHHGVVQAPMAVERQGKLRDDVARISQNLAHVLEGQIRAAPTQWHLMVPNWPSDVEALRQAGYT